MTCDVCQSACYDLLDRSLSEAAEREVLAHVAQCPQCRAFLEEEGVRMRTWPRLLATAARNVPVPPETADRVAHALEISHGRSVRHSRKGGWVRLFGAHARWIGRAAAFLVLAGIGAAVWRAADEGRVEALAVFRLPSPVPRSPSPVVNSPVTMVEWKGAWGLELPPELPGRIRLAKGQAKVRLPSGADLSLLGPLEL